MRTSAETQPERTALAWQRTGLGVMAVAALLGHTSIEHRNQVLLVLAGLVALLGLTVLGALAPVRYRQVLRMTASGDGASAPRLVLAAALAVAGVALTALVATLTLR